MTNYLTVFRKLFTTNSDRQERKYDLPTLRIFKNFEQWQIEETANYLKEY